MGGSQVRNYSGQHSTFPQLTLLSHRVFCWEKVMCNFLEVRVGEFLSLGERPQHLVMVSVLKLVRGPEVILDRDQRHFGEFLPGIVGGKYHLRLQVVKIQYIPVGGI